MSGVCDRSHHPGRGADGEADPDVPATTGRGLTNHMRDSQTIQHSGESVAIIDGSFNSVIAAFRVEVKAQQPKQLVVISQANTPRRCRFDRTQPEQTRVLIHVQQTISLTHHHPHLSPRTNPARQSPRGPHIRRHAEHQLR
ncbi:hypothetical protein [Cryobacterium sp. TMT2-23]|uniref:hypothetical protein n=1 Tax=Cryobacterium sp. TMT2-23 TaxID=1259252 RepID=UPI001F544B1C|nr:hypothetical protein [Cryobacterium sp. TMT2-23]